MIRARLVFGKTVRVEAKGKDKCKRSLGRVFVDNTGVNAHLVAQGFAWHYAKYSRDKSSLG